MIELAAFLILVGLCLFAFKLFALVFKAGVFVLTIPFQILGKDHRLNQITVYSIVRCRKPCLHYDWQKQTEIMDYFCVLIVAFTFGVPNFVMIQKGNMKKGRADADSAIISNSKIDSEANPGQ